jgi:hypothetical protein
MPVDFFEKELGKTQNRFNQTFGSMPLCNPTVRIKVIFAIVQMCILHRKIIKDKKKEDIIQFVKIKDRLNNIFSTLIEDSKRRHHDKTNQNKKTEPHDPGLAGHEYKSLPALQNSLHARNF